MLFRGFVFAGLTAACLLGGAVSTPAQAACYKYVGCTNSDYFDEEELERFNCGMLAEMRNSIYAENGYCFKKRQYQRMFGNQECEYEDSADVPLNRVERANVAAIRRVERMRGCGDY